MAAPPVARFPIFMTVRVVGVVISLLLLTWALHFRGGLALISDNKDLIFNVILLHFHSYNLGSLLFLISISFFYTNFYFSFVGMCFCIFFFLGVYDYEFTISFYYFSSKLFLYIFLSILSFCIFSIM